MTAAIVLVFLWELAFPLAIVSRLARRIILPLGVVFHVSTLLFMNLFFPYHLAAYAVFIDWPRVISALGNSRFFRGLKSVGNAAVIKDAA
jgi:hypothetical protein